MFNDERDFMILNENAYFYTKNEKRQLTKKLIEDTFKKIAISKHGHYLYKKTKETIQIDKRIISYSICVFKFTKIPSLIKKNAINSLPKLKKWLELKTAYLIILEIDNYVVITKKNIKSINCLLNKLTQIDYEILSSIFINDNTSFEQFSLQNLNISNTALRSKSVAAVDLKENFSTLGASNYIVKTLRVSNDSEKTSLALNTSRINKFGQKNNLETFFIWSINTIKKINNNNIQDSFLSIFAIPQDFEKNSPLLKPTAILFDTNQLLFDIEIGKIEKIFLELNEQQKELDIVRCVSNFQRLLKVTETQVDNSSQYRIENKR